ncbi:GeoRSP system SPASM domain protein [Geotalea uraniireducens]|uniref:GeoRSP system SPASM domain protein n=1 Tax=Geotalea uraniireducens TaxID=351604 RepID=A0ABN6VVD3_9BACT|nr:GeoRSP system SPASM domain protein [Geotalea uraniireducens]BDV44305.1 GeoRSP system SPASM domain protein [Geotalea uraniireducens]
MELATPITIYWDLPPRGADPELAGRIAAGIVACRPLMVQLTAPPGSTAAGVAELVELFRGAPSAVSLTVPLTLSTAAIRRMLVREPVQEFLVALEHAADLIVLDGSAPCPTGVSIAVNAGNWWELPAIIARCRQQGISRIVLPMQRLYGGERPFCPTIAEQRGLATALAATGVTGLKLTIHDPFLWRAFNPGEPFPQGGCQAANTMLAIAPDGGVYPCPTLPVRLGTLETASLAEIVASPAKKEFRRRLLETPAACRDCPQLVECCGGCRGRAYVMQGSLDEIDPACR